MKLKNTGIKNFIFTIGFKPQKGDKDIYFKNYSNNNYILKVAESKIKYLKNHK